MRSSYYIYPLIIAISVLSGLNCAEENIAPVIEITGSTVWVIDQPSFTVIIFDSEGDLINTVDGFLKPIDLDIDQSNGDTWVVDFYGDQLKKFDRYGNILFETPPPIDNDFYLRQPTSVCVEQETSDVWVADYHQNKVLHLDPAGNETGRITGFVFPRTVNIYDNSGQLWVTDEGTRTVYRFSTDFTGEITADVAEIAVGGFDQPRNILSEADGGCWVLDIGSNRLYKLSPSGEIVATVSGFDEPSYMSLGSGGASVLVCDSASGNVYEIDRRVSGNVNVTVEGQIFLTGLNNPRGLVTDELAGVVYVCVMNEDRVVKCDLETGEELLNFTPIEGPLIADFYRVDEQ